MTSPQSDASSTSPTPDAQAGEPGEATGAEGIPEPTTPGPSGGGPPGPARESRPADPWDPRAWDPLAGHLRLLLALFAGTVYALWSVPVPHNPATAWAAIAGAITYSTLLLVIEPRETWDRRTTALAVSATDALLITIFLAATGGWASPWFPLWYLSILGISLRFGTEETMAAGSAYVGLYGLVAAVDGALLANLGVFVVRMSFVYAIGALGLVVSDTFLELSIDRHRYEALAQERSYQASLLQSTLQATEDGIAVVDEDGDIVLWNARFSEHSGIPATVLDGGGYDALDHLADRLHEPDPGDFKERVYELAETPDEATLDEIRLDDGRVLSLHTRPQRLEGIVGRVWTVRDVTESKRLLERVEAREREFRELFETVPVGLFESTRDRSSFRVNETTLDLLGYGSTEALRENADDVWPDPEDREDFFETVMEDGSVDGFETEMRRADGELIAVQMEGTVVVREEGQPMIRGAVMDVTERKQMEEELRAYARRLEESNEDLEQFASAVSHDLRTPLGGILANLDLLEEDVHDALDEEARESFDHALEAAERMDRMIEDLLEYARLRPDDEPAEVVDPEAALEEAMANLEHRVEEEGATVTVEEPLPPVKAHRAHVLTILQNLLSNALRYRDENPPEVQVRAEEAGDGMVRLSVSDNGEGIPEAEQDDVLELFSQGSNRRGEGTGTGLATCRRLVRRYDGSLDLESTKGQGTTVHFTLPGGDGGDGEAEGRAPEGPGPGPGDGPPG